MMSPAAVHLLRVAAPRPGAACHDPRMPVTDAARERAALCDEALRAGPDAPTLCEGWVVRDLVVHLVVRDGRPDVALGAALPPLREHARRVQDELAALPFEQLVDRVRTGPSGLNPTRLPAVDELVNRAEFYVHHEDVRRAGAGAAPRELPRGESEALWKLVRTMARLAYRRSGTGVVLVVPGGPRAVVRRGAAAVSLTGQPQELLLHAFGRRAVAQVAVDGSPDAVARFLGAYPA